jgi:hypothetical protein
MKTDYREAIYSPVEQKTFRSALMNFLQKEFPNMGGPLIMELFIDKIENLIERFYPPTKHLKMGQILWFAVAKDEKPSYGKSMRKTRIVPVVLTLVNHDDISKLKNKTPIKTVKRDIMARLYQEADDQGGTLSETDISLMLMMCMATVSKHTLIYEKEHQTTLPRRGTVHDMGTSMSHKRLICKKRKIERKSTSLVARETNHSHEAVERYTLNLDRVTFCLEKNLSIDEASFVTGLSKNLIVEYRNLDQEIKNNFIDNNFSDTLNFDDIPF